MCNFLIQYPDWLSENEGKVESKEFANYKQQYELMSVIVTEFESESESDSDEVKKRRFDKIMDTMQQMQELGQPPKEIVGEMVGNK